MNVIGITISVNYYDKLPHIINNSKYLHKWYFVVCATDIKTIHFLENQSYNNINILYYDNFFERSKFNKSGAINFAQQLVHKLYPNDWILLLDSDIILPDIFSEIKLNQLKNDTLYGILRNDYSNKQDLIDNKFVKFHNHTRYQFVGYFQLYFDKNMYYDKHSHNCAESDIIFLEKFNNKILLDGYVKHLGHTAINWNGRIEQFW